MNEATMTDADMKQRENIVKSMKKNFKDFRKRYGADAKNVMYATATKMSMKEAVKDEADKGEYDYEGDMAKSSLRTISRNAEMMHDMLGEDTNLPEWVQSKITLAEDYIVSAAQYMQSEMKEEVKIEENKYSLPAGSMKPEHPEKPKSALEKRFGHLKPGESASLKGDPKKVMKKEEVELDEISKELARKAVDKASEKTRVAAYHSIYGGKSGHKMFQKAVRQHKKFSDYAYAKTPKVPYVKEEEQMDEYNATPYRSTERGARGSKRAGQPRTSNFKQFFRPPEGFTKKGIEKGGGVKTVYHYKGKSNTPSGATMKMGGVKVNLGKTFTKRRPQEGSK